MISDTVELPVFVLPENLEELPSEWIKPPCEEDALYGDCPRMQGEGVCYGQKVPLEKSILSGGE